MATDLTRPQLDEMDSWPEVEPAPAEGFEPEDRREAVVRQLLIARTVGALPQELPEEISEPAPEPAPVTPVIAPDIAEPVRQTFGSIVSLTGVLVRERIQDFRGSLDRRTVLDGARQALIVVGVLLLALASFLSAFGGLTEREAQRELNAKFTDVLKAKAGYAPLAQGGIIPAGSPVAVIEVPRIGVRQVVVEGTTSAQLAKGPGHLRSTPIPGQHGNAVIAGRRTTFGGPFHRLNELASGDSIRVTTALGHYTYDVVRTLSLRPGQPDQLGASVEDILTLTTSDPIYRATRRLVVIGKLQGERSPYPDPLRPVRVGAVEGSFFGDASKAIPAAFWEITLLIALLGARSLYKRWHKWPTYLMSTPIILALGFAWLLAMAALLPSTL